MPLYHCLFPSCSLLPYCLSFALTSAAHQQFKNDSFSILPFPINLAFFQDQFLSHPLFQNPLLHCVPLSLRPESYSFLDPVLATEAAPSLPPALKCPNPVPNSSPHGSKVLSSCSLPRMFSPSLSRGLWLLLLLLQPDCSVSQDAISFSQNFLRH